MYQKKKNYVSKWSKTLLVAVVGLLVLSSFPTIVLSDEGFPNIPEIRKDGPEKVYPDQIFDYTISFANEGNGTAENVSVIDELPEHVDYQGSVPQGGYDPNNHTVSWNFPEVQSEQPVTIILTVQVKQDTPHESILYNYVELTYEDSQQNQYGPICGFTIAAVMADPMIDVSCEAPVTADAGQSFSYMISLYNKGYPSAINVEVTDYLSHDVIYDSSTPPGQYNQIDHTVFWLFGSIEPEETVYIQLNVTVENDTPPATNLVNIVEVEWQDSDQNDYGPVSDIDSTTVTGDWTIGYEENVMRSDETIVVTGSILVETGGRLTLDNVNLRMKDPPGPGDFGIQIMPGGELNASNDTVINAFETDNPYFFNNWGNLILIKAKVSCIRGISPVLGGIVNLEGANFYCTQSEIVMSETVGVTVAQGATATIDYSYIKLNGGDGIHAEGDTYIKNSVVENNMGSGIYWLNEDVETYLEVENVRIEENAIGIFCESPGVAFQGENIELENARLENNSIDNMMMYNFDPILRGKHLQIDDDMVVISSDYVFASPILIKNDIQVKVLDDGYDPVPYADVKVTNWPGTIVYDYFTNVEGLATDIEVPEKTGMPKQYSVPFDYMTTENLETMPYLSSYFEIVGAECRMRSGYYFNKVKEPDFTYQKHEIEVAQEYTALEGYEAINPSAGIMASTSYDDHAAMFALDYDPSTYWSADRKIGNYMLLIDLTEPQPIRYVNIYYQYTGEQSWFEGQSYVIEGYNEAIQEWEVMCSVDKEENVLERKMEAPPGYWVEGNPLGWVSKVRMRIIGWTSHFDPGIRLIDIQDVDADGLLNWYETSIGLCIWCWDSDGDGMSDLYELIYGWPFNPWSWFNPFIPNHRYAVLIGKADGGRVWFWNDLLLAYYMLHVYRGFTDENIYCLYDDGNMDPDNPYISWYPGYDIVDGSATLTNIRNTFITLSTKMTWHDLLFVYLVDHGSATGLDGRVSIYGGVIRDDQLAEYVGYITPWARKVITIDACFSGSFIDDLSAWNRIITTCAPYDDYGWGYPSRYTIYAKWYLGALNRKYPDGSGGWTPLNADYNRNREISIKEAYLCDVFNDNWNYAMYDDNGNPWDPWDPNNDGPGYHGDFTDLPWWSFEGLLGGHTYLGKRCFFPWPWPWPWPWPPWPPWPWPWWPWWPWP